MGFTALALLAGVVLGFAAGGRLRNLRGVEVRAVGALAAAAALQAVSQVGDVGGALGLACILASYGLLVAFGLANARLVGMPVVLTGLVLNVLVITVNGGMPVRAEAILTVDRDRSPAELAHLEFGAKRHLETGDDHLTFLGDVLPVQPIDQVLSFGDLILSFGVANVVFRLLRPVKRRQNREDAKEFPLTSGVDVPIGSLAR
jgi:hypothetical protein